MSKQILVNSSHYETRVATLENGEIRQLHIEREEDKNVVGNIYLGVVKRVLPGMQAAFLELGLERTAFLYVDDIIEQPFGGDVEVFDTTQDEGGDGEPALEVLDDSDEEAYTGESFEAASGPDDVTPEEIEQLTQEENKFLLRAPAIVTTDEEDSSEEGDEDDLEEDEGDEDEDDESFERPDIGFEVREDEPQETVVEARAPLAEEPKQETQEPQTALSVETETAPVEMKQREEGPSDQPQGMVQAAQTGSASVNEPPFEESHEDSIGNRVPGSDQNQSRRPRENGDRHRGGHRGRNDRNFRDRGPRDNNGPRDRERYPDNRGGQGQDRDRGPREAQDRDRGPREGQRQGQGRRDNRGGGPRDNFRGRRDSRNFRGGGRGGGYPRRGSKQRFSKRRPKGSAKIEDLLKEGQEILVQVAKAPIGTKGARLTTHISLPGRNLVLMPTVKHIGISRRIDNDRERRRLRDIFTKKLRPRNVGFIIRTVADGKSFRDLKADADYLVKSWAKVQRLSKTKSAPALIHEDLSLSMRVVRDFFTEEVDQLVIDNSEEHDTITKFIGQFMPRLKPRVKLFKGPTQLFEHYGIEAEISRALGKKVWLKSGGYLLVDQSEALTAIDVNTGRYVGTKSLEETILKTNLEAVKEIAYQLRIRNVGGIIIIDLIDMENYDNREKVYQALQEALSEDKSKTNILKISELGLVEMTRKRTHEDLVRYLTEACTYCDGRGYHKSRRTVCFEIFREIEKEALSDQKNIVVFAAKDVVARMMNEEKKHVNHLEQKLNKTISVKADPSFHMEQFEVFGKH